MPVICIGDRLIGDEHPTFIIAEIGATTVSWI
jgi:sialic acid synthase SpsE